jgi:homospermidine synthase
MTILKTAYQENNFPKMGQLLTLRVIHCSERDTQIPEQVKPENVFWNTWGSYSLYGEGVDPIQIGWGTHEQVPSSGYLVDNCHILSKRGAFCYSNSYVPTIGKIKGMLIPHGENITLNKLFTLYENGIRVYAPSNYYVYSPADMAWTSMAETVRNDFKLQQEHKSLRGLQLRSGSDIVGALLMFEFDPYKYLLENKKTDPVSYWAGSILSLDQTRKLGIVYSGPTTVQVAISIIAVLIWISQNKQMGLVFPEQLPYEQILNYCMPYLGTFYNGWVNYNPKSLQFYDLIEKFE